MYVQIREHQVSLLQDGHQMICWALLDIKTEDSNRDSPWCSYKWTLDGLRGLTWLPYYSWVPAIVQAFLWHKLKPGGSSHCLHTFPCALSRCCPEPTFPLSFLSLLPSTQSSWNPSLEPTLPPFLQRPDISDLKSRTRPCRHSSPKTNMWNS